MSDKVTFSITSKNVADEIPRVASMINKGLFKGPVEFVLKRPGRSLDQNKKLWAMLADVTKQVDWYKQNLDEYDWKTVFVCSLFNQRSVPSIDGGFVGLSRGSSRLNKKEFSDLIELIYAFGSEKGVHWSKESIEAYENYKHKDEEAA